MEVLPMTRTEAVKDFFKKAVLPVAIAGLLYCIFKSACMRDGELDLPLALDTLRPALRHPSDVRVDRAGQWLPGRRRRAVRAELRDRRPHRGLRPGVAPAGGGMVCAPHHLPPDCGIIALWKCGKRPLRRWKTDIHGPMEKPPAFPQPANIVFHSFADMAVYTHSHSACCCEHPSCPTLIEREKREQKKKRERHPRPKPKAALPLPSFSFSWKTENNDGAKDYEGIIYYVLSQPM